MLNSVLYSKNFNSIKYGTDWILEAGEDKAGRKVLYLKKFDFLNSLLNILGCGEKDPSILGLLDYFRAWLRIGNFSLPYILQSAQNELNILSSQKLITSLVKKNIEFINIQVIKDPSQAISIPKLPSESNQLPKLNSTTHSTFSLQPHRPLNPRPQLTTTNLKNIAIVPQAIKEEQTLEEKKLEEQTSSKNKWSITKIISAIFFAAIVISSGWMQINPTSLQAHQALMKPIDDPLNFDSLNVPSLLKDQNFSAADSPLTVEEPPILSMDPNERLVEEDLDDFMPEIENHEQTDNYSLNNKTDPLEPHEQDHFQDYSNIQLVTGYKSGNPKRDEISQLVEENQKAYAQKYNYQYKSYHTNLAQDCLDKNGAVQECQPYWNKIAILKRYLDHEQLREDSDEWIVWLDDDMVITNPHHELENVIQSVKTSSDTSLIVTLDPQNWHKGNRKTSVNTGALIVRKTPQAKKIIDSIWALRNQELTIQDESTTLGTCKNQICFHEQQALAYLLETQPELISNKIVSVIEPNSQGIGLNTIARKGVFFVPGQSYAIKYEEDDLEQAVWNEGDFTGQCSGLPTYAYTIIENEHFEEPKNIRLECIKKLIDFSKKIQASTLLQKAYKYFF